MRLLVIVLMLLTSSVFAQDFTIKERDYFKATFALEQLRDQRNELIAQRDSEIATEDSKHNATVQIIVDNYEIQIDAKETEIAAKETLLNSLITTP